MSPNSKGDQANNMKPKDVNDSYYFSNVCANVLG